MNDPVRIELQPLGVSFQVERGTPLQDCLFPYGVEFPCGGRGRCKGCRVRVLAGELPISAEEERMLSRAEIADGWRLACRAAANGDLTLEIAQWETTILADSSPFEFSPGEGLGITVDLGTTTIVAQLLDLATGRVLGVRTGLNPQARRGSDVMTRIAYALGHRRADADRSAALPGDADRSAALPGDAGGSAALPGDAGGSAALREDAERSATFRLGAGQTELQELVREEIGRMARGLLVAAHEAGDRLRDVVIVGNTVMHHLFSGIDVEPLSRFPFDPLRPGLASFRPSELGWDLPEGSVVRFLPCLGSFVGSDILAGILATRIHESPDLEILVDLGTNGEIVVGNRERLLCTSTAAGPAFEGARISMGMRASTGAIAKVRADGAEIRCHVLGGVAPRGVCGSGLVDAVAVGLDRGIIRPNGRFADGSGAWELCPPVAINQTDVREIQLAKGAIAAGIRILLERWGATKEDVKALYLAGAFGNYVSRRSSRRIGLLDFPLERIRPAGNTALLGAKVALFNWARSEEDSSDVLSRTEHIGLSSDEKFQETYVEEMLFG